MVGVRLGAKARNYDFNVSDVDLDTFQVGKPNYKITGDGITISHNKSNYVTLDGQFKLFALMSGDYEKGIRRLDSITVVEDGKVSYAASGLDMTGKDAASGAIFKKFLATEHYSIKGNDFNNDITGATRKDVIHGLAGNDVLEGMGGNDRLNGGAGRDRLVGGEGNDILTGGPGSDLFIFDDGDGKDVITDFRAFGRDRDIIDFRGHADVDSFRDLEISHRRSTVTIQAGDDVVVLTDVDMSKIGAGDFLF